MAASFLHTMLTPAVRDAQRRWYGRARPDRGAGQSADELVADELGDDEVAFLQARDSFYLATVTETGWPYVQHRGGPPGFLCTLSPRQLAFADFGGNRQLISVGNLAKCDRIALLAMDYAARVRLKVIGQATVLDAREHPELVARLTPPGAPAAPAERIVRIDVVGFDWNCPKFITPRFTAGEVEAVVQPLRERIADLEAEVQRLRGGAIT